MVELFEARKIAARTGLGLQYVLKEDRVFDILRRLSPIILSEDIGRSVRIVAKGGTAMNKVHFRGSQRFSEDLDFDVAFVEDLTKKEKIAFLDKNIISALRGAYDVDKGRLMRHTVRFTCTFTNEMGMKDCVFVEFNIETEVFGKVDIKEAVSDVLDISPVAIPIYSLPSLVARKMVAFSDRFSGKDLYDIYYALERGVDLREVVKELKEILKSEQIEPKEFVNDLIEKLGNEQKLAWVHASTNPYLPVKLRKDWVLIAKKVKEDMLLLDL